MRDVRTMVRWTCLLCFVLSVIIDCAVVSAITKDSIASTFNFSLTESPLELRSNKIQEDSQEKRYHLPICCPNGSYTVQAYWCTPVEEVPATLEFPPLYDARTLEPLPESLRIDDFDVLWNSCQGYFRQLITPELYEDGDYKLLSNGSIHSIHEVLDYNNYCFAFYNTSDFTVIRCVESAEESEAEDEDESPAGMIVMFVVSLALRSISFSALLVTLVLYSVIPELRSVYGASFRGFLGQLIFSNLISFMRITDLMQNMNTFMCLSYGFLRLFSNLAVFFWLNVLCFDMWRSFGTHRRVFLLQRMREWRQYQFIINSIYALGCSSLITIVGLIMDLGENVPTNAVRPEFDVDGKCFFKSTTAGFIYYYGPMGLMVFFNACFFILVAVKIRQQEINVNPTEVNNCRNHGENMQRFKMYRKLFILTGVEIALNLIVWLCNYEPEYLYTMSSLYDHAQGILIYVIIVWKDKKCQSLRSRQDLNATSMRGKRGVSSFIQTFLRRRPSEAGST